MARPVTFDAAARLVADDDHGLLDLLDHLLSGILLVTGQLALFDPKNDLIRIAKLLRDRIGPRLREGARRDRGNVMVAAHTILVVSAYIDELAEFASARRLPWRPDQVPAPVDPAPASGGLLGMDVPVPSAAVSREELLIQLKYLYGRMAGVTYRSVTALGFWDRWPDNDRIAFEEHLRRSLPTAAVRRYDEYIIRLTAEQPTFGAWIGAWEHASTSRHVDTAAEQIGLGFDTLGRRLSSMSRSDVSRREWQALARRYAADLDRPVATPGEHGGPPDMVLPSLAQAYVSPAFQVTIAQGAKTRAADDDWWRTSVVTVRNDIEEFLIRHLNSPEATQLPLLVLGEPGAGKSVFIRALAGRLLDTEFLPLRVDLRRVPADASVVDQVHLALRDALQRDAGWADLIEGVGGGTPIVFFDGYDELLQSSGTSQSDYLERIREFQVTTSVTRDCPVAVVVTSRTVVTNAVRVPDGTTIVRLEPFDAPRIARWLDVWNGANTTYFERHGLRPLHLELVTAHQELATQPLLLLMLALYDADGNALQGESGALANANLYERLLSSFAHREMRKGREQLETEEIANLVDQEMTRLAVAALAMFNRGLQHVADQELREDLDALLTDPAKPSADRSAQNNAQRLIGRFFFVHVSVGQYDRTLRTYEFLHATFGEYLVAWFIVRALPSAPVRPRLSPVRAVPDDGILAAILSHELLVERGSLVGFLGEMLERLPDRSTVLDTVVNVFQHHASRTPWHQYERYRPRHSPDLAHGITIYSANLVLLVLLLAPDRRYRLTDLFATPSHDEIDRLWRGLTRRWLAVCDDTGIQRIAFDIEYVADDDAPFVRLRSSRPWQASIPFGDIQVRNDLLREPEITALLAAVDPVVHLLGHDLVPPQPSAGQIAPAHGLLHLLFNPASSAATYRRTIESVSRLHSRRSSWYAARILDQLTARPIPMSDPLVLDGLVRLFAGEDPSVLPEPLTPQTVVAFARLVGRAVGIDEDTRIRLVAQVLRFAEDHDAVVSEIAVAAERDAGLVVVVVDVLLEYWSGLEPAAAHREADLLMRSSDQVIRMLPADRAARLRPILDGRT